MKLYKLLRQDIIQGIWERKIYFLLPVLVAFFSCAKTNNNIQFDLERGQEAVQYTVFDFWIPLVMGMRKYTFDIYNNFLPPILWLSIYLFLLVGLNNYLLQDLNGWGQQAIIKSQGRILWWTSKVIWGVLFTCCYFVVMLFFCIIFGYMFGGSFSLKLSADAMRMVGDTGFINQGVVKLFAVAFLQPLLLGILLGMLQMVLTLVFDNISSIIVNFIILLLSCYYQSIFLIGNLGMPLRMKGMGQGIYSVRSCIMFMLAGTVALGVLGYLLFRHRDILEK